MHLTLFFLSPAMSPGFWARARRHAHERSLPTPMKPAHISYAAALSPWWSSAVPLFTHRPTGAVGPDAISCYTPLPGHNPRLCQRLSRNGGACPFLASRKPGGRGSRTILADPVPSSHTCLASALSTIPCGQDPNSQRSPGPPGCCPAAPQPQPHSAATLHRRSPHVPGADL